MTLNYPQQRKTIVNQDRYQLGMMLIDPELSAFGNTNERFELEFLLEDASVIAGSDEKNEFARMNSAVRLLDLATHQAKEVVLVFPEDVDLHPKGVSVLDPLGVAILGCELGDVIYYKKAQTTSKIRIDSIASATTPVRTSDKQRRRSKPKQLADSH